MKKKVKEAEIIDKNDTYLKKEENNIHEYINKYIKNNIFVGIIGTFMICLLAFGLFYNYYLKDLVIETTKLEKDVTITDSGIADAVEKVYDSVVVVETFVNDKAYASGTGFVFKKDNEYGYILTNYHVINESSTVKVSLTNNETVEAKIVGSDEYSDIAVLSIDVDKVIQVAQTGSSIDARVGDTTFAVGAPIDSTIYSWSVTRGILSGKNRLVEVEGSYNSSSFVMEVLQTDTAINSGNSGGPLCNSNGEVIGITNMKLASSSIEGMGFAIPIEEALEYAESIITGKNITRPYLGISMYDSNGFFNNNSGIYIDSVENNSPADKSGLKKGDKITKINDVEVKNISYFKYELYKYDIGDKVKITVERDNKEKNINVTLGSNSQKS